MRMLHTADWHLGHRLYGHDRMDEQRLALDWLLETIREREVELLIVAGDIFDSMNPSNAARNLYYDFLGRLQGTTCRTAVIVGGNHDSPTLLDAPAAILRHLNVHLVGGAREDIGEQVIPVHRHPGEKEPAVIVAAVPYLRDRDLKYSVIGETATAKVERLRLAIRNHYGAISAAAADLRNGRSSPVVATGHLFASGATDAEDKLTNIYLADRNNIGAEQFDPSFDYVALGHIHRAQRVGELDHVRYSGSLIPLTFGEARGTQSVCLVECRTTGAGGITTEKIPVPVRRRLYSLRGSAGAVERKLRALVTQQRGESPEPFAPWVEIRVEADHPLPMLREELQEIVGQDPQEADATAELLPRVLRTTTVRTDRLGAGDAAPALTRHLHELEPEEVFYRLCHGGGGERPDYADLVGTFRELRGWMTEHPAE